MLKAIVDSLDDVAEPLHEFYRQEGDRYILDLDGVEDHPKTQGLKSALDKERGNKKTLAQERKELEDRLKAYEDLDPEEARAALQRQREIEEKKLLDEGEIDKLLEQRTGNMKSDYEKRLGALDKKRAELEEALSRSEATLAEHIVFGELKDVAVKAGVRATALDDVLNRGRQVWRLEDGRPVARENDEPVFGPSGKEIGMDEWIEALRDKAPHLYEESKGGGARGSSGSGGSGGKERIPRSVYDADWEAQDRVAAGDAVVVDQ